MNIACLVLEVFLQKNLHYLKPLYNVWKQYKIWQESLKYYNREILPQFISFGDYHFTLWVLVYKQNTN